MSGRTDVPFILLHRIDFIIVVLIARIVLLRWASRAFSSAARCEGSLIRKTPVHDELARGYVSVVATATNPLFDLRTRSTAICQTEDCAATVAAAPVASVAFFTPDATGKQRQRLLLEVLLQQKVLSRRFDRFWFFNRFWNRLIPGRSCSRSRARFSSTSSK